MNDFLKNFNPLDWSQNQTNPETQGTEKSVFLPNMDKDVAQDFERLLQNIERNHIDLTATYDDWFRCGTAIAAQFGEQGRSYFHRLSQFYPGYNQTECDRKYDDCLRNPNPQVNMGTIFHLAKQAGIRVNPIPPKENATQQKTAKKTKLPRTQVVELYMKANYQNGDVLRFDILTQKIQISKQCNNEIAWEDIDEGFICTVACNCSKQFNVNITPSDVHTVLNSNLVKRVHPLKDWLKQLEPFQQEQFPNSPIEQLANQVHVVGNQEEWVKCFKKWFVAMVASWLCDDIVNHQVLVLIGPQGSFKTTWLERLMPPQLRAYSNKLVSNGELSKDERLKVVENGLINLDEIDAMRPKELNGIKSLITTPNVNERAAYAHTKVQRPRLASFCASGNNHKFLSDVTGNRRWMPFLIESIDNPWETNINYEAVYAEALALFNDGFQYWFDANEIATMAENTDEFRAQYEEEELLDIYFAKADKDSEKANFLSAAQIHEKLTTKGAIKHPVNNVIFNNILQKHGFEKRKRNGKRGYLVIEHTDLEIQTSQLEDAKYIQAQMRLAEANNGTDTENNISTECSLNTKQDFNLPDDSSSTQNGAEGPRGMQDSKLPF